MVVKYRHRAPALDPVTSLTAEQHAELKKLALEGALKWSTSEGVHGEWIARFRTEAKDYYHLWQRRRCCYCSSELQKHGLVFDAEHILDQSEYPEYMFEAANFAAACKLCNQRKSNKSISASGLRFVELSQNTDDYSIVHPHLDEWNDHLDFDSIGRIVPSGGSKKGVETIRVCGMAALNAARLADAFAIEKNEEAQKALRTFHDVADLERKKVLLSLLEEMAKGLQHPGSRAVIDTLRWDVAELEAANNAQMQPGGLAANFLAVTPAPSVPALAAPTQAADAQFALLAPPGEMPYLTDQSGA